MREYFLAQKKKKKEKYFLNPLLKTLLFLTHKNKKSSYG